MALLDDAGGDHNDVKKLEIYALISNFHMRISLDHETVEDETVPDHRFSIALWDSIQSVIPLLPVYLEQRRLENSAELGLSESLQTG